LPSTIINQSAAGEMLIRLAPAASIDWGPVEPDGSAGDGDAVTEIADGAAVTVGPGLPDPVPADPLEHPATRSMATIAEALLRRRIEVPSLGSGEWRRPLRSRCRALAESLALRADLVERPSRGRAGARRQRQHHGGGEDDEGAQHRDTSQGVGRRRGCVPNIGPDVVAEVIPVPSGRIVIIVGLPKPVPSTFVKRICRPSGVHVG
jgi:hypothetical protein